MRIGWIARNGKFYHADHTEHWKTAELMPEGSFPAVRLCQNGFAFFEHPASELTQAQIDALWEWCQEKGSEPWEVIADFLGIEQEYSK